jgi:hypothetical protein
MGPGERVAGEFNPHHRREPPAFTLDTYGHVMPGQQADAAAAVARLVNDR